MTRYGRPADAFEAAYAAPMVDAAPPAPPEVRREALEGHALAAPGVPFALKGYVVTPDVALENAYVVVSEGLVADVTTTPPADVRTIDTGGVIMPGLIDLHGHPEYNVLAPWEPPKLYQNRYQWRGSREYAEVVRTPWARLTDSPTGEPSLIKTLTRYAEARALVGGTTSLQGAGGQYPDPHESLVRNVDRYVFGRYVARSLIDLGRATPDALARLKQQIASGEVKAVYVHLCEGVDESSRAEFDDLVAAGLLTPATVIIHGTALDDAQLTQVRDAGAKLVWSPQSNLRMYGATTRAARALTLGIPTGLGADWQPSGSPSLLDELQVARRVLRLQGSRVAAKRIVQMVTTDAARIAALSDRIGRLRRGAPADVLVLERRHVDPYESILLSDRRGVELVVLGGDVAYGRRQWVEQLAGPSERELVVAWGKDMALDLVYSVIASDTPPPRLADLRAEMVARYPAIGPIFA
ncbi:MAG TPA: amidohydrolase family protein [Actinomycetota bacterium]|nr:amidohydrolase family protein [Actinomycetota bacterium]